MIYPIVLFGDPVLRKKAEEIPKDTDISQLIADMFETMKSASGVGLAAPQIGQSVRLFVVDSSPMEDEEGDVPLIETFVNPVIVSKEGDEWAFEEGCLSIPGIREDVLRPQEVTVRYFDKDWNEKTVTYDDLKARIIQHEYDHIEGILFTDHLSPFKKRLLKGKMASISKGRVDADYRVKAPRK